MTDAGTTRVTVMSGNEAAATAAELARVQVIAAYPITPQSPVVEQLSHRVEHGGFEAEFVTVESEHSALTVCLAASTVGARTFTATSSNGLAYMNEQVWWTSGARLPVVMCVANRALAAPWNVLNDQQDSMSERDAGWVQLYCRDNQEILDSVLQAYRLAELINVPVMVCYDGFLLSHTVMPVEVPEQAAVDAFLPPRPEPLQVVDADDPRNIGQVTLADPRHDSAGVLCHGYMELRHLHQLALLQALEVIPQVDAEYAAVMGRACGGLFWTDRFDDAEVVLVAAGSLATQLTVTVDELRGAGVKAGVLGVRAYRPFPAAALRAVLAGRRLALVFDKALSYGFGGPICNDLRAALCGHEGMPLVYGAICGLGGRDTTPQDLLAAAQRALADQAAGVRDRDDDWLSLRMWEGQP